MGRLTTHILDTEAGRPAAGVAIEAFRIVGDAATRVGEAVTNADGRTPAPILEGEPFQPGVYELRFKVGPHLAATGRKGGPHGFLDVVVIRFGVASADEHYHVPLLLQAHGYSTYRGS
jgi:5-hydroxyisourate hydrolase